MRIRNRLIRQTVLPFLIVCGSTLWMVIYVHTLAVENGPQSTSQQSHWYDPFSSLPELQQQPPSLEFSACLLIMDDNHFLIEWLAYHYFAANLRTLVVVADPNSQTSPHMILERWKGKIDIIEWVQQDFMNKSEFRQAQSNVRTYFGEKVSMKLVMHRARQRLFYYKCMKHLQQMGKGWTLLIDTDEFLTINYKTATALNITAPPMDQPGCVATFLQEQLERPNPQNSATALVNLQASPCIQIPRSRFGVNESSTDEVQAMVPAGGRWNGYDFQTLRWRTHTSAQDYKKNRISKTILDLKRVSPQDLVPVDSIHLPIRRFCTQRKLHTRAPHSLLKIHHYLGTFEQYTYRENDARLGNERSVAQFQYQQSFHNPETDDDIRPWLSGFVQQQTKDGAAQLLHRVGQLDKKSWQAFSSPKRCALVFFGLPRAYREMVLPSIIQNILIPNARHQCDIYVHFFLQYSEKPGRKNKGGTVDPQDVFLLESAAKTVAEQYGPSFNKRVPHVAFTHDTEEEFWDKRRDLLKKYHNTLGPDGKPAYFPWKARTYIKSSLDNMVKQWHSIEYGFKLMEASAKQLNVTYSRVGMFRSDAMYLTEIDIASLDQGVIDTGNNHAVLAPFSQMPVNDRMIYGPYKAVKIWATRRFELIEERVRLRQDPGFEMHSEHFLNASILPEIRELVVEIHINKDICFVRTRADMSAMVNDCVIGGMTRGWNRVDPKALVENIVQKTCTSYKMGARWTFVGCGDGIDYKSDNAG